MHRTNAAFFRREFTRIITKATKSQLPQPHISTTSQINTKTTTITPKRSYFLKRLSPEEKQRKIDAYNQKKGIVPSDESMTEAGKILAHASKQPKIGWFKAMFGPTFGQFFFKLPDQMFYMPLVVVPATLIAAERFSNKAENLGQHSQATHSPCVDMAISMLEQAPFYKDLIQIDPVTGQLRQIEITSISGSLPPVHPEEYTIDHIKDKHNYTFRIHLRIVDTLGDDNTLTLTVTVANYAHHWYDRFGIFHPYGVDYKGSDDNLNQTIDTTNSYAENVYDPYLSKAYKLLSTIVPTLFDPVKYTENSGLAPASNVFSPNAKLPQYHLTKLEVNSDQGRFGYAIRFPSTHTDPWAIYQSRHFHSYMSSLPPQQRDAVITRLSSIPAALSGIDSKWWLCDLGDLKQRIAEIETVLYANMDGPEQAQKPYSPSSSPSPSVINTGRPFPSTVTQRSKQFPNAPQPLQPIKDINDKRENLSQFLKKLNLVPSTTVDPKVTLESELSTLTEIYRLRENSNTIYNPQYVGTTYESNHDLTILRYLPVIDWRKAIISKVLDTVQSIHDFNIRRVVGDLFQPHHSFPVDIPPYSPGISFGYKANPEALRFPLLTSIQALGANEKFISHPGVTLQPIASSSNQSLHLTMNRLSDYYNKLQNHYLTNISFRREQILEKYRWLLPEGHPNGADELDQKINQYQLQRMQEAIIEVTNQHNAALSPDTPPIPLPNFPKSINSAKSLLTDEQRQLYADALEKELSRLPTWTLTSLPERIDAINTGLDLTLCQKAQNDPQNTELAAQWNETQTNAMRLKKIQQTTLSSYDCTSVMPNADDILHAANIVLDLEHSVSRFVADVAVSFLGTDSLTPEQSQLVSQLNEFELQQQQLKQEKEIKDKEDYDRLLQQLNAQTEQIFSLMREQTATEQDLIPPELKKRYEEVRLQSIELSRKLSYSKGSLSANAGAMSDEYNQAIGSTPNNNNNNNNNALPSNTATTPTDEFKSTPIPIELTEDELNVFRERDDLEAQITNLIAGIQLTAEQQELAKQVKIPTFSEFVNPIRAVTRMGSEEALNATPLLRYLSAKKHHYETYPFIIPTQTLKVLANRTPLIPPIQNDMNYDLTHKIDSDDTLRLSSSITGVPFYNGNDVINVVPSTIQSDLISRLDGLFVPTPTLNSPDMHTTLRPIVGQIEQWGQQEVPQFLPLSSLPCAQWYPLFGTKPVEPVLNTMNDNRGSFGSVPYNISVDAIDLNENDKNNNNDGKASTQKNIDTLMKNRKAFLYWRQNIRAYSTDPVQFTSSLLTNPQTPEQFALVDENDLKPTTDNPQSPPPGLSPLRSSDTILQRVYTDGVIKAFKALELEVPDVVEAPLAFYNTLVRRLQVLVNDQRLVSSLMEKGLVTAKGLLVDPDTGEIVDRELGVSNSIIRDEQRYSEFIQDLRDQVEKMPEKEEHPKGAFAGLNKLASDSTTKSKDAPISQTESSNHLDDNNNDNTKSKRINTADKYTILEPTGSVILDEVAEHLLHQKALYNAKSAAPRHLKIAYQAEKKRFGDMEKALHLFGTYFNPIAPSTTTIIPINEKLAVEQIDLNAAEAAIRKSLFLLSREHLSKFLRPELGLENTDILDAWRHAHQEISNPKSQRQRTVKGLFSTDDDGMPATTDSVVAGTIQTWFNYLPPLFKYTGMGLRANNYNPSFITREERTELSERQRRLIGDEYIPKPIHKEEQDAILLGIEHPQLRNIFEPTCAQNLDPRTLHRFALFTHEQFTVCYDGTIWFKDLYPVGHVLNHPGRLFSGTPDQKLAASLGISSSALSNAGETGINPLEFSQQYNSKLNTIRKLYVEDDDPDNKISPDGSASSTISSLPGAKAFKAVMPILGLYTLLAFVPVTAMVRTASYIPHVYNRIGVAKPLYWNPIKFMKKNANIKPTHLSNYSISQYTRVLSVRMGSAKSPVTEPKLKQLQSSHPDGFFNHLPDETQFNYTAGNKSWIDFYVRFDKRSKQWVVDKLQLRVDNCPNQAVELPFPHDVSKFRIFDLYYHGYEQVQTALGLTKKGLGAEMSETVAQAAGLRGVKPIRPNASTAKPATNAVSTGDQGTPNGVTKGSATFMGLMALAEAKRQHYHAERYGDDFDGLLECFQQQTDI